MVIVIIYFCDLMKNSGIAELSIFLLKGCILFLSRFGFWVSRFFELWFGLFFWFGRIFFCFWRCWFEFFFFIRIGFDIGVLFFRCYFLGNLVNIKYFIVVFYKYIILCFNNLGVLLVFLILIVLMKYVIENKIYIIVLFINKIINGN